MQQLEGCGLRQQAGRDDVLLPMLVGRSPSQVDGESRRPPGCKVSTRQSNVLADLLNCRSQVIGTEWSLHPWVVRVLLLVWGSCRSTCLRLASMQSCPYTASSSRISRRFLRMRFSILETTCMFTRFHPFLSSDG